MPNPLTDDDVRTLLEAALESTAEADGCCGITQHTKALHVWFAAHPEVVAPVDGVKGDRDRRWQLIGSVQEHPTK